MGVVCLAVQFDFTMLNLFGTSLSLSLYPLYTAPLYCASVPRTTYDVASLAPTMQQSSKSKKSGFWCELFHYKDRSIILMIRSRLLGVGIAKKKAKS